MIIKCPMCGAGNDEIIMTSTIAFCDVSYDEEKDEFEVEVDPANVEEVDCQCMVCDHEWEWDAYRRNIKEENEND